MRLVILVIFLIVTCNCNSHVDVSHNFAHSRYQNRSCSWLSRLAKGVYKELQEELCGVSNLIYQYWSKPHAYQDERAHVRYTPSDELCQQEKAFCQRRVLVSRAAIEQFLQKKVTVDQVPTIAVCCSGGGFRAMVSTLGFLQGMRDIGLLGGITYVAGLSGSTWAIAPWIASGKTLEHYIRELPEKIAEGIVPIVTPHELSALFSALLEKIICGHPVSIVDIYGPLLANVLLDDLKERKIDATLSETHAIVSYGLYPMPIYTAISSHSEPYEWFEVTPFEIGSSYLRAYIPIWSYGRKFYNGVSRNSVREQTLGYYLGVFGSAFEVSMHDAIRLSVQESVGCTTVLPDCIAHRFNRFIRFLAMSVLHEVRLLPSTLDNFAYHLNAHCPYADEETISLIDAGIDCNLPVAPLLREHRAVDIIIMLDSSSGSSQLYRAQQYARRKGLLFPPINYTKINQRIVSVFKDEYNPHCPVIIYFPLLRNTGYSDFDPHNADYCNTFNFNYSQENIEELSGLTRYGVNQEKNTIKHVIEWLVFFRDR